MGMRKMGVPLAVRLLRGIGYKEGNMISIDTLKEIISDTSPQSSTLLQVGLVGSYANHTATPHSDVDLVFDTSHPLADEAILTAGLSIKKILQNQFNLDADIIHYPTIVKRANHPSDLHPLAVEGYQKMLGELVWIWRKNP